jgi:hypothetical protein
VARAPWIAVCAMSAVGAHWSAGVSADETPQNTEKTRVSSTSAAGLVGPRVRHDCQSERTCVTTADADEPQKLQVYSRFCHRIREKDANLRLPRPRPFVPRGTRLRRR